MRIEELYATIAELTEQANHGNPLVRSRAVLQLARYRGFPLQDRFVHWLEDPEQRVERAAALALLQPEHRAKTTFFDSALKAPATPVRANAAWGLGRLGSPEALGLVRPLLTDPDATVRSEAHLAVSRLTGNVPATVVSRPSRSCPRCARGRGSGFVTAPCTGRRSRH